MNENIYPEVTTPATPLPSADNTLPEFPKSCPVCGACVVESSTEWCREMARYACGGEYTSKPQIQNHTNKWWGSCPGNDETFKKVKTIKQINADPRIEGEIWNEGPDGWWASLVDGYQQEQCSQVHGLHEYTIKELAEMLNLAVCRCEPGCPCGHGEKEEAKAEVTAAK